jgi:hypothetical protein
MHQSLKQSLSVLRVYPYQSESCYPLSNAQRNLSGRTHYVDDDALRYFKARINSAHEYQDGLLFCLIESVGHPSLGRVHRFVAFDVFGDVVTERESFRRSSRQAEKDKHAFLASFDAVAHTWKRIGERFHSLANQLAELETAITCEE